MRKPLSFFLADDDADDREFFILALKKIDPTIKCIVAKDGSQALEIIKGDTNFTPDFVFLDFNMPRMNGKECFLEMKKIDRLKNIPFYIYSTSLNERENLLEIGITDYIQKPYTLKELITMLAEIIEKN
jgi:CheY-like chemotaxis protein